MADLREVFPILADSEASGAGYDVTRAYEFFPAASVSGAVPSLVAKNNAGNLVFLQLDAQGRLPVSQTGSGDPMRARGELLAGVTSGMTEITGAKLTLVSGRTYVDMGWVVSCFRECHAQLVWNNNGSANILTDVLLGPGQYTFESDIPTDEIVAGSGTQELLVQAYNIDKKSAIRASLGAVEVT